VYPKHAPQPIREEALLGGPLEPTNRAYAVAKIAGLETVHALRREWRRDYFSVMPTNLYGPRDNYDPESSHLVPALIRRAHAAKIAGAKELIVWGTGTVRRDLMYSLDAARAIVLLAERYPEPDAPDDVGSHCHVNVGTGNDRTVREIAETIARVVGFGGTLTFDPSRPDGTPQKALDLRVLAGWGFRPRMRFEDGLRLAYEDALARGALS
jgi:GDP-L-fucose synthase